MMMKILPTALSDVFWVELPHYPDERGYFTELFHQKKWLQSTKSPFSCVQVNQSYSQQHVLRGLHFQAPPYAQSKLIQVLRGEILDVAVDLRPDSPTYGQHLAVHMSENLKRALFIPKGFAHGLLTLSPSALVQYLVDHPYTPSAERGLRYDDPHLNIAWPIDKAHIILSEKDKALGSWTEAQNT